MTVAFQEIIELVGKGVDAAGVGIVVVGVVVATALAVGFLDGRYEAAEEARGIRVVPPASDLELQREAEERPDQHDPARP
jgi:hypothetical protein